MNDNKNSLLRRTLLSMAMVCGSTVALTLALSLTAFFVCGHIASSRSPEANDAKSAAPDTATPSKPTAKAMRAPKAI